MVLQALISMEASQQVYRMYQLTLNSCIIEQTLNVLKIDYLVQTTT